jgi:hypothetical protein
VKEWGKITGGKPIHLAEMRLGSSNAPKRWGQLLKDLAPVPLAAGLRPFVGSVKTSDYADSVRGTVAELVFRGYPIALLAMVDGILNSDISKQDRIEFIFEQQKEFDVARGRIFADLMELPEYKTHHNKSRIAKHSVAKRSLILEASDYLAYAVLQHLIDPSSQKATLTSPMLEQYCGITHREFAKEQADAVLELFRSNQEGTIYTPLDNDREGIHQKCSPK